MQESTVYRSIQKEAQKEEKRAISINLLRGGIVISLIASATGLSVEEGQQLQQQADKSSQN